MKLKKIFNKKFWIGSIIVVLAGIVTIIGIVNFKRSDTYQMALENIAEARFYLKTAGTDNPIGNVQLYSGIRETDYQADGIATQTVAFTVLSVEPTNDKIVYNGCITTLIKINDQAPITLVLEKNPYGNNYAGDLESAVDVNANINITFQANGTTIGEVALSSVMPAEAISWENALEIACQTLDEVLNTDQRVESSTKILCDNSTVNTPYWFVSFVTEDGNRYFVVISHDGKVIGTSEK
ncbi:MAG: hypothetical protein J6B20_00580 [Clostridia bacterium]|nr:hypothetical protein [Clostridia bacterium]